MDTELLVENRIDDGRRLLVEFARNGFDISAAAWLKTAEEGLWYLYVGSPAVAAGTLGDSYLTVYRCLQRLPNTGIEMSTVKLVSDSNPIAREIAASRDRHPGGRLATRYGGNRLGNIAVEEAYIYPRITPGLTRDEVLDTVTALMKRNGPVRPSNVTLRDGTVIRGVPYALEMSRTPGQPGTLEVKILDDADGSTRTVPADEVTNIL